ncbi:hypothetical protein KP509_11G060600 [Ceratopteris richardii]|uniref:(S)-ureidoglycine aminohydrolase cupin domain-containing protein n=1 Tax=Ceratopteris richardii TaxID=49495 RepID=A0A8T2TTF5_CERRI|nr:hypothetical protein KP509_11G060600 [Ceratopteris richardii]
MAAALQAHGVIPAHAVVPKQFGNDIVCGSSRFRVPLLFRGRALVKVAQPRPTSSHLLVARAMASEGIVIEKIGVRVERNPPESRLSELGVRSWPKWGCPPSKFPWTYSDTETCYLLKGKVKVYGEGSSEYVEIGAGDLVVFPKGMSCTWDVSETVDKHYNFS